MKKIALFFVFLLYLEQSFAAVPDIDCWGLPCPSSETSLYWVIGKVITAGIKYVAVIAVLAVMFWWIMYLISSGQEEKTKKAKNIIIWALVWTFLSVWAWGLINIINNFRLF